MLMISPRGTQRMSAWDGHSGRAGNLVGAPGVTRLLTSACVKTVFSILPGGRWFRVAAGV